MLLDRLGRLARTCHQTMLSPMLCRMLGSAASPTTSVVPVVGSTTLVPTSDGPPCVLMMYANCRAFSKFTPRASVLGEVLGHLEVIDTPDNRDHLVKRFRSSFHNHFTHVPVDVVQRHHALFRKASKPVIGLKLMTAWV